LELTSETYNYGQLASNIKNNYKLIDFDNLMDFVESNIVRAEMLSSLAKIIKTEFADRLKTINLSCNTKEEGNPISLRIVLKDRKYRKDAKKLRAKLNKILIQEEKVIKKLFRIYIGIQ
ncbi:MAG: hypothetical protein KAJ75_09405, partial [Alphaproteobacteria bacterium]|nr:hypothetical protein [Alphaproteobacteria bacterium]